MKDSRALDLDWFATDQNGFVAHLTSAGCGVVHPIAIRSENEIDRLLEFFETTAKRDSKPILYFSKTELKELRNTYIEQISHLSACGIYCFDALIDPDRWTGYRKIAAPEKPIHFSALPALFQKILSEIRFACDFQAVSEIQPAQISSEFEKM